MFFLSHNDALLDSCNEIWCRAEHPYVLHVRNLCCIHVAKLVDSSAIIQKLNPLSQLFAKRFGVLMYGFVDVHHFKIAQCIGQRNQQL